MDFRPSGLGGTMSEAGNRLKSGSDPADGYLEERLLRLIVRLVAQPTVSVSFCCVHLKVISAFS